MNDAEFRTCGERVRVVVRLPESLHGRLKTEAERLGISPSLLVGRAVDEFLGGCPECGTAIERPHYHRDTLDGPEVVFLDPESGEQMPGGDA